MQDKPTGESFARVRDSKIESLTSHSPRVGQLVYAKDAHTRQHTMAGLGPVASRLR